MSLSILIFSYNKGDSELECALTRAERGSYPPTSMAHQVTRPSRWSGTCDVLTTVDEANVAIGPLLERVVLLHVLQTDRQSVRQTKCILYDNDIKKTFTDKC